MQEFTLSSFPASSASALQLQGISKRYGATVALHEVHLSVRPNECTLLLGSNGAGKSTLLRLCSGLARPDQGFISYEGKKLSELPAGAVAYLGHNLQLYSRLTVLENLKLANALLGEKIDLSHYLQEWQLESFAKRLISDLSKGQQLRAALARALIGNPQVVLLDEPTSALDDAATELLLKKVSTPQRVVMIATHDVNRLQPYAQRIVVLHKAKLALDSHQFSSLTKVQEAITFYRDINR